MFPIIPTHMLTNGSPSSSSIGKITPANADYSNTIWNIWTDELLRRKYISATASNECVVEHPPPMTNTTVADSIVDTTKPRDSKRLMVKNEQTRNYGSYALETIPKDSKSRPFECIDVTCAQEIKCKSFIYIDSCTGFIANDQNFPENVWVRSLTIAHDTYSHNAQLEITSDHRLRVKIVKHLVIDEEIQLWFSDEILAIMTIPFLTPANILGKNCYKCIECNKTYENPNPLKMHLAMKCDRYTMNDLWIRLNGILPLKSYTTAQVLSGIRQQQQQQLPMSAHSLQTDRLNTTALPILPPSLSTNFASSNSVNSSLTSGYHPFQMQHLQQLSAFRPVPMSLSPHQIHHFAPAHSAQSSFHSQNNSQLSRTIVPTTRSNTNTVAVQGEKVVAAAAAQLETIVSNMGTSKQGHICIYCGKLYSRKYGLKIHIRTHTGFKPLKCKYCLRPFGDPSNLNKHIRLHVQENSSYKCHVCNKILLRRRDLLRHMNIKHNVSDPTAEARFSGECDTSNDNTTFISSANEAISSRSSSVSSADAIACNLSSNDDEDEPHEMDDDYDDEDDDDNVRIDVD